MQAYRPWGHKAEGRAWKLRFAQYRRRDTTVAANPCRTPSVRPAFDAFAETHGDSISIEVDVTAVPSFKARINCVTNPTRHAVAGQCGSARMPALPVIAKGPIS